MFPLKMAKDNLHSDLCSEKDAVDLFLSFERMWHELCFALKETKTEHKFFF